MNNRFLVILPLLAFGFLSINALAMDVQANLTH
jgi:hypothetical protein